MIIYTAEAEEENSLLLTTLLVYSVQVQNVDGFIIVYTLFIVCMGDIVPVFLQIFLPLY